MNLHRVHKKTNRDWQGEGCGGGGGSRRCVRAAEDRVLCHAWILKKSSSQTHYSIKKMKTIKRNNTRFKTTPTENNTR